MQRTDSTNWTIRGIYNSKIRTAGISRRNRTHKTRRKIRTRRTKGKHKMVELIERTEQPLRYRTDGNNWTVRTNKTLPIGGTNIT